jgi:S1 RNA binding domain protein
MTENQDSSITTGTITGITSFGAFVKLQDGQEGLVHISEIADAYITNIGDYLTNGQEVKVKVLGTNKKGKLDLSIKKVPGNSIAKVGGAPEESAAPRPEPQVYNKYKSQQGRKGGGGGMRRDRPQAGTFEDKMNQFLKKSDEKLLDVRKNTEWKQGVRKKKKQKDTSGSNVFDPKIMGK